MSKRSSFILSLAIGMALLAVLPALAESVDTAWVRRYSRSGVSHDRASALVVDSSGNVYVTGTGYATIKYYPNGDTAWVRRYDGDMAHAVAVDGSGNVYVTGVSHGSLTIKYYPNGDTAWVRRYSGFSSWDMSRAIAVDDSGNVYVTGDGWQNEWNVDYATIKYYPDGATAWRRTYGGGFFSDDAQAIAVDDSGNVYVTGYSTGSFTAFDWATIKYYPDGDTAWARRYYDGRAFAIAADGSGHVYVTGNSYNDSKGNNDYATIKYYPNGDTAWVRKYDGPGGCHDRALAIAVDSYGNVYVTGESCQSPWPETNADYATIKYYPNGDTAWVRRYNGLGDSADVATAIAVDSCGNTCVTGYSWNGTDHDYATLGYDASGNELWVERYNGPGNGYDKASDIAVYGCDNVYVTGESWGGALCDYATIKYVQNDFVRDETGDREKPSEFTLSQNYPNPFNQVTKIEFTLGKSGFASLNIYDILGRKVRILASEQVSSGYKSVLWDGKNDSGKDVASGIYFYQLKVENPVPGGVGDFTETKKLVLLK